MSVAFALYAYRRRPSKTVRTTFHYTDNTLEEAFDVEEEVYLNKKSTVCNRKNAIAWRKRTIESLTSRWNKYACTAMSVAKLFCVCMRHLILDLICHRVR